MIQKFPNRPGKSSAAEITKRRKQIANRVSCEQFVSVQNLVAEHGVTSVTIRGDIEAIASASNQYKRVRGGVMRVQQFLTETRFEERTHEDLALKQSIGTAAASIIQPNESIILDVGTTTIEIARAIVSEKSLQNVTVFTNALNIASVLESAWPRIQTVVTGGTLRPMQHSLIEPMAGLIFREIRVAKAFLACNGIDAEGNVSTTNLPEAEIKKKIIGSADKVFLVADASKFGRRTLARVCNLANIQHCLFAGEMPREYLDLMEDCDIDWTDAGQVN